MGRERFHGSFADERFFFDAAVFVELFFVEEVVRFFAAELFFVTDFFAEVAFLVADRFTADFFDDTDFFAEAFFEETDLFVEAFLELAAFFAGLLRALLFFAAAFFAVAMKRGDARRVPRPARGVAVCSRLKS